MAEALTVKEAMNVWGRAFLSKEGYNVSDTAEVTFTEDTWDSGFCETCSYIEYCVDVSADGFTERYYGTMGELIEEMN